jgi:hypothetical protein
VSCHDRAADLDSSNCRIFCAEPVATSAENALWFLMLRKFTPALLLAGAIAAAPQALAADAIPGLSGSWGRLSVDFEQPPSGIGPIANLNRKPDGTSNGARRIGNYNDPNLMPAAAAEIQRMGEYSRKGETFPNPQNQCRPQGVPYVLWQLGMQLLQEKDQVTLLYLVDHQMRHVRLNQQHPPHVVPSWSGDSVGHYEGDTLVIDTVGVKYGPFSMMDQYGTPYSPALHVIERYRLIDGMAAKAAAEKAERENGGVMGSFVDPKDVSKGLQVEVTVEDPAMFHRPWTGIVTYRPGLPWLEYICAESPYDYVTGQNPQLPTAERPDF